VLALLVVATACEASSDAARVDAAEARAAILEALQRYQAAARVLDADAMAAAYAPDAILFEPGISPIVTRDSIRAFIASFPGVRVDSATATPDEVQVFGSTGYVWGSYFESLAVPGQPASEQHGQFVIEWVRSGEGDWLIRRFFRVPVTTVEF
jgi:uncharacterized protein (TIGR02246 family)